MATKTDRKPKKPAAARTRAKSAAKPAATAKPVKAPKPRKPSKPKTTRAAKSSADKVGSRPEVSEIVAAALVGAAAALRDPNKARQLAASVGEDIEQAAKGAAGQGAAIWQLAMDVAKRSVDALGSAAKVGTKDKGKKKKKKKKK